MPLSAVWDIDDETTPPEPPSEDPLPSWQSSETHDESDMTFAPARSSGTSLNPVALATTTSPMSRADTPRKKGVDNVKPGPATTDYPEVVPTDPPPPPPPKKLMAGRKVAVALVTLGLAIILARAVRSAILGHLSR